MKEPIRKICLDGVTFNWRVTHRHKPLTSTQGEPICRTELLVFRQGTSNAALRIAFSAGSAGGPGYIAQHGVLMLSSNQLVFNLHKPRTVEIFTRRALDLGWSEDSPLLIEDGFSFVADIPVSSQMLIAEPRGAAGHG